MMTKSVVFVLIVGLALAGPATASLKIELEPATESNLFVELPLVDAEDDEPAPNVDLSYFTFLQPSTSASVRASFGPIAVRQTLTDIHHQSPATLPTANNNDSLAGESQSQPNLNGKITAHLVTKEVKRNTPTLKVLFYAGQSSEYSGHVRVDSIDQSLCAVLAVEYQDERLTGVCQPGKSRDAACIAQVTLPASWWPPVDQQNVKKSSKPVLAKVKYTVVHSSRCDSSANQNYGYFSELADVALTPFRGSYEEVTNDNIVTILIPQEPTYPNSKLYIPVKFNYNPEYPLSAFSLRVKAKPGVRILGAQLAQPDSGWQLSVEVGQKQNVAIVTAYLQELNLQEAISNDLITNPNQEVYSLLIEIDEQVDLNDGGRIVWQILYLDELTAKRDFDGETTKLTSRLDIQKDDIFDVVAITKYKHLLNTAVLTGRQHSKPMRVYMVSKSGRVSDVTLQSSCHSLDESVLKVSPSCTSVYLDGSEVRGSQNASILIKYGTVTGYGHFVVWMPKLPLEIKVSDVKLSQIKGWKVPHLKKKHLNHHHLIHAGDSQQSIESTFANSLRSDHDKGITDDGFTTGTGDISAVGCRLRYQQASIEVYTRFFSSDHNSGREAYLLNRRLAIKITPLVLPFIRVSDPRILLLRGNIIEGLSSGHSELQLISPIDGKLMGANEIRVTNDKETLTHLDVKVVAGLQMRVEPHETYPNVWMSRTSLISTLTRQYQEGLLDIQLRFSDGSRVALADVTPSDYNLAIDTVDEVLAFAPLAGFYPRVIAISPGDGQLINVSLDVDNQCQKKKSHPIVSTWVNILVNFSAPASNLQNDAFNFRKNNGVTISKKNQSGESLIRDDILYQDKEKNIFQVKSSINANDEPKVQAHKNMYFERSKKSNTSSFQVGMYSIVGVFSVAVFLLMGSCLVFALYAKQKSPLEPVTTTKIRPLGSSNRPVVANANDWVWLGKATLERNLVNTQCSQKLIQEKDLNGNPIVTSSGVIVDNFDPKNRSSGISIPGSEISIRITTNPNAELEDDGEENSSTITIPLPLLAEQQQITYTFDPPLPPKRGSQKAVGPPVPSRRHIQSKYTTYTKQPPPIPPHRNLNQTTKRQLEGDQDGDLHHDAPPPVPPHRNVKPRTRSTSKEVMRARKRMAHSAGNMNYNQLVKYFDNLKESNA